MAAAKPVTKVAWLSDLHDYIDIYLSAPEDLDIQDRYVRLNHISLHQMML